MSQPTQDGWEKWQHRNEPPQTPLAVALAVPVHVDRVPSEHRRVAERAEVHRRYRAGHAAVPEQASGGGAALPCSYPVALLSP